MSYTRINSPRNYENPENLQFINDTFRKISDSATRHDFGILFNAFTESAFGERFSKYNGHKFTHADSGGLQVITQGKTITPALKDAVYAVQAKWSDLGMCFDEIPIGMTGTTSGRNDVTNRWYKSDDLEHYARLTGRNIARQIEVYHKLDSKCKPILIAQGNCYDSYMRWVDYIMDEIPASDRQYVGGVAMGAAALGTGTLEDIERAFIFSQLQIDVKHLHVLGVGSVKRLYPYLVFQDSGLYKDITLSYDSTSHTSGGELANYYTEDFKRLSFTRQYSRHYEKIFNEIAGFIDVSDLTPRDFHEIMNSGYTKYVEELNKKDFDFLRCRLGIIFRMIHNFINHVEHVMASKENMIEDAMQHNLHGQIKFLYGVKDKNDFDAWNSHFKRTVKSNRVQSGQSLELEF